MVFFAFVNHHSSLHAQSKTISGVELQNLQKKEALQSGLKVKEERIVIPGLQTGAVWDALILFHKHNNLLHSRHLSDSDLGAED